MMSECVFHIPIDGIVQSMHVGVIRNQGFYAFHNLVSETSQKSLHCSKDSTMAKSSLLWIS
jgi:hypothetical protein